MEKILLIRIGFLAPKEWDGLIKRQTQNAYMYINLENTMEDKYAFLHRPPGVSFIYWEHISY